jgi:hypothetical protein
MGMNRREVSDFERKQALAHGFTGLGEGRVTRRDASPGSRDRREGQSVYKAEADTGLYWNQPDSKRPLGAVKLDVRRAWVAAVRHLYPGAIAAVPRVLVANDRPTRAGSFDYSVSFGTRARSEAIILHELAHVVDRRNFVRLRDGHGGKGSYAMHGLSWRLIHIALMEDVAGKDDAEALVDAYKSNGLEV